MTHGSLFSGVGGFDLAAQWMGWENAFHCEINPFVRHVLNYYWPNATSYEDITKTDFTIWRGTIDVLTGGFPCQPFSLAGKRKGAEDERHLWPEMLRAIREIEPRWIVGENVFGLVNWDGGLVFEQVQTDLEAEGYEVQPYILPAAGVNAPHRRDRVWFVAHSGRYGGQADTERESGKDTEDKVEPERIHDSGAFTHAVDSDAGGASGRHEGKGGTERVSERDEIREPGQPGGVWDVTDPRNKGSQGREVIGSAGSCRQERHKQPAGRVCPDWDEFPTQPPVRGRDDGFPAGLAGITVSKHRNESIKAYGNAIVPQVVLEVFKAIEQWEHSSF